MKLGTRIVCVLLVIVLLTPSSVYAWSFNQQQFYGCAAVNLSIAAIYSFALGPAGPQFFFLATAAVAANCGGKALTW